MGKYAKILGGQAADLLSRITDGGPFTARFIDPPREGQVYELAVRIAFQGVLAETRKKARGHLVCGLVRLADNRPLLKNLAAYLGLEEAALETETGPQNVLNECWNIITGLAEAAWTEQGFEMNFSTPHALSGQLLPPPSPGGRAFYISLSAETGSQVNILLVFNDRGPAV